MKAYRIFNPCNTRRPSGVKLGSKATRLAVSRAAKKAVRQAAKAEAAKAALNE